MLLGPAARVAAQIAEKFLTMHTCAPLRSIVPWLRNASAGYAATYARQVAEETARVHDPWDSALFAAAQARFRAAVRAAGLSRARCEALCPDAPSGAFESATSSTA